MRDARWIRSPAVDAALALCWVPFAVVAHAVRGDSDTLLLVLSAAFLLSFLHQPLTLPLVYGDPDEVARHRRIYLWSPLVFVAVILVGLQLSLAAVAVVAGLWNAEHTLMQRFGITRIYGRKKGQSEGGLERWMLVSWLVLALVWVASDASTESRIEGLKLGQTNADGLHILADLRPVATTLLLPVLLVVVGLAVTWLRTEARRLRDGTANPAKHLYVASTAALFAWILVEPISGFIAYIGSHSVEYFLIVHHSLGSRYADGSGGRIGAAVRAPGGRRRFLLGYLAVLAVVVVVARGWASDDAYRFLVLFLGGLHVFYDGLIWKLRRPAVARGLVEAAAPAQITSNAIA
jgi:hypothetical protein